MRVTINRLVKAWVLPLVAWHGVYEDLARLSASQ